MKDIKITRQNYKQLFECAGFKAVRECSVAYRKELTAYPGGHAFIELNVYNDCECDDFSITASFGMDEEKWADLSDTNNSTAEIDRIFYPFLSKPLVWDKKWDFGSVFHRSWGEESETAQLKKLDSLYYHSNPRVKSFSRLLFVMNKLNKEYKGDGKTYSEVFLNSKKDLAFDKGISFTRIVGVWVFNDEVAAELFIRDNESDLRIFYQFN